ncbi:MAG: BamA/TamA family outer membrane protein, partial [Gammaproteobacteria bacterium]|nr:BamA/TamA family outer membrane protein [Gammaproteobacteria bacterium]
YWTGYGSGLLPGYLEEFEQRQLRGLGVAWIHPLSRFKRVNLGVDIVYEKSYHYIYRGPDAWNAQDYEWEPQRKESWYVQPRVSWVFDSAIFGPTGPLSGRRTRLSAYATIGKRNSGGVGGDHRLYFNIRQRYALAWRGVIAGEWGPDRSRLVCGGPYSLRGFTDCPLWGNWIVFSNLELRFPFIEHLYIAWPVPLLIGGIRGSLFFDMGAAWSEIGEFRGVSCKNENDLCELDDLKASFGLRTSMNVGIAILRWDLVRRSKMSRWDGKTKGEFSIGLEF